MSDIINKMHNSPSRSKLGDSIAKDFDESIQKQPDNNRKSNGGGIWEYGGRYYYRDSNGVGREANRVFTNYLDKNRNQLGNMIMSNSGSQLIHNGTSWFTNGRVYNSKYGKGSWDTKNHTFIGWDKDKQSVQEKPAVDKQPVVDKSATPTSNTPASNIPTSNTPTSNTPVRTTSASRLASTKFKSFSDAFNAYKKAGQATFTWRGKEYNTISNEDLQNAKINLNSQADRDKAAIAFYKGYHEQPDKPTGYLKGTVGGYKLDDIKFLGHSKDSGTGAQKYTMDDVNAKNPVLKTPTAPTPDTAPNADTMRYSINQNYDRSQVRQKMRDAGLSAYHYSGSQRRALRNFYSGNRDASTIQAIRGMGLNDNQYSALGLNNFNKYSDDKGGWNIASKKQGGIISKFEDGGTMNEQELQQKFLQYLAQQTGAKSMEELQQVMQQMGKEGLQEAYTQFVQAIQQQQVQAAKFGAKLNYINRLNGKCPDGSEPYYFKSGGTIKKVCKKCMEMEAQGGSIGERKGNAIDQFKADKAKKAGQSKATGYLSNRKDMNNFQKLQDFNRNHPYEDRSVDLNRSERATQDSLKNEARKDGSWQRATKRK